METIALISAYLQVPLALLLAWHCARVRPTVTGWINWCLLSIICACAGMIAWRLTTFGVDLSIEARVAGGTGFQTLFIVAIYVLVSAIGSLSDQNKP